MYAAYKAGRLDNDPSCNWYKGEIGTFLTFLLLSALLTCQYTATHTSSFPGFFDFYIIPLAKKLQDCGVFGVSSDEFLNYALRNRNEWEQKGQAIVDSMMERIKSKSIDESAKPVEIEV